jgi:hypothetical protein
MGTRRAAVHDAVFHARTCRLVPGSFRLQAEGIRAARRRRRAEQQGQLQYGQRKGARGEVAAEGGHQRVRIIVAQGYDARKPLRGA